MGLPIPISKPDKVLFPGPGFTKQDLAAYYLAVAPALVPFLRDRPLTVKQYPEGVNGKFFFRKSLPRHAPPWVASFSAYAKSAEHQVAYPLANDERTLVWLAGQAAIELHPWLSRVDRPEHPDLLVFDLDPGADLGFAQACEAAFLVRERLAADALQALPKLSGKRGVHVLVPLARDHNFEAVRAYAEAVGRDLAEKRPDLLTAEYSGREERRDRVLVDYAQNSYGRNTVAPYSVRAVDAATVSVPLTWEELAAGPDPRDHTIATVPDRLARAGDPLAPLARLEQKLPEV
jgi:bifunctional non-homologous end joining protein LigD